MLDVILEDLQFPYELGTNAQIGFDEPDGPDETDLTVVVEMFLPREEDMPNVAEYKYNTRLDEIVPIMLKQRERSDNYEELVAQTALATMFRVFHDAQTPRIQRIIFNGYVDGIHAATGQPFQRCVLTVEWTRQDFEQRDLSQVKAVKCLHDLRGLTAGPLVDVSPVTPIRALSNRDDRFVDIRDVLANHPSASNIATMPWRDFEHLVATLFQKMYGESGEVHLTRTSRDRGVDALVLDRDPLRGGRIVIQAKQYPNRLVPPAHVRELLGTMTHERATRGALVTTGYFSSDSKEYAEEHNIMLYEGPQLLDMLLKHGFQVTYQV